MLRPRKSLCILVGTLALAFGAAAQKAPELNGFRLTQLAVPLDHILAGGPGRDGIKSVDAPTFAALPDATWVAPQNPVLGVQLGDEARVYPIHLIERHQVVNDEFAGDPVAVTYGPLSGAPAAYRRKVDGRLLQFGVSGLLYNGNFLLYDRETGSLWSQFTGKSIAGELSGKQLERVEIRQELLAMWLQRHPESKVLERPFLEQIDYRHSPYERYWVLDQIPSRVDAKDERFHPKELTVGIVAGGKARAYLGSIAVAAGGVIEDEFQGHAVRLVYDSEDGVFQWTVPAGVQVSESYWFAWKAFHPDTEIWNEPAPATGGE